MLASLWALACDPADPFLIQLKTNDVGKAAEDGSGIWVLATMCETLTEFLGLAWFNNGHCGQLGSQPVDERCLCLSLSVTMTFKKYCF